MRAIEAEHLKSAYGKHVILQDAGFCAEEGQCIGIVGANGCGKSTLLSILAGTLKPKSGSVKYFGHDAWQGQKAHRNVICQMTGYVPQENPLLEELSVYDNLRLWYPNKQLLQKELTQGTLCRLGINEYVNKKVGTLSGGMKKRVSLAIAISGNPPILILDEPGAALDMICKEIIRDYLKEYLKRKGTVVITSHEEGELALCDRLYVMKNGSLWEVDHTMGCSELTKLF